MLFINTLGRLKLLIVGLIVALGTVNGKSLELDYPTLLCARNVWTTHNMSAMNKTKEQLFEQAKELMKQNLIKEEASFLIKFMQFDFCSNLHMDGYFRKQKFAAGKNAPLERLKLVNQFYNHNWTSLLSINMNQFDLLKNFSKSFTKYFSELVTLAKAQIEKATDMLESDKKIIEVAVNRIFGSITEAVQIFDESESEEKLKKKLCTVMEKAQVYSGFTMEHCLSSCLEGSSFKFHPAHMFCSLKLDDAFLTQLKEKLGQLNRLRSKFQMSIQGINVFILIGEALNLLNPGSCQDSNFIELVNIVATTKFFTPTKTISTRAIPLIESFNNFDWSSLFKFGNVPLEDVIDFFFQFLSLADLVYCHHKQHPSYIVSCSPNANVYSEAFHRLNVYLRGLFKAITGAMYHSELRVKACNYFRRFRFGQKQYSFTDNCYRLESIDIQDYTSQYKTACPYILATAIQDFIKSQNDFSQDKTYQYNEISKIMFIRILYQRLTYHKREYNNSQKCIMETPLKFINLVVILTDEEFADMVLKFYSDFSTEIKTLLEHESAQDEFNRTKAQLLSEISFYSFIFNDYFTFSRNYTFNYLSFFKSMWDIIEKWEFSTTPQAEVRDAINFLQNRFKERHITIKTYINEYYANLSKTRESCLDDEAATQTTASSEPTTTTSTTSEPPPMPKNCAERLFNSLKAIRDLQMRLTEPERAITIFREINAINEQMAFEFGISCEEMNETAAIIRLSTSTSTSTSTKPGLSELYSGLVDLDFLNLGVSPSSTGVLITGFTESINLLSALIKFLLKHKKTAKEKGYFSNSSVMHFTSIHSLMIKLISVLKSYGSSEYIPNLCKFYFNNQINYSSFGLNCKEYINESIDGGSAPTCKIPDGVESHQTLTEFSTGLNAYYQDCYIYYNSCPLTNIELDLMEFIYLPKTAYCHIDATIKLVSSVVEKYTINNKSAQKLLLEVSIQLFYNYGKSRSESVANFLRTFNKAVQEVLARIRENGFSETIEIVELLKHAKTISADVLVEIEAAQNNLVLKEKICAYINTNYDPSSDYEYFCNEAKVTEEAFITDPAVIPVRSQKMLKVYLAITSALIITIIAAIVLIEWKKRR